jgi:hypothetical protein
MEMVSIAQCFKVMLPTLGFTMTETGDGYEVIIVGYYVLQLI